MSSIFDLIKTGFSIFSKIDNPAFRRKETEKEFKGDSVPKPIPSFLGNNFILIEGKQIPINAKVVQMPLSYACYKTSLIKRDPKMIVTHWDAALSAKSCFNILQARQISSHFCIDNVDPLTGESVIYQFVDANNIAWHAGPGKEDIKRLKEKKINIGDTSWNALSIGIDFSNAYYAKYNSWYLKNIGQERPVINSVCHKQKLNHLGYYPEQIEAYTELVRVLCEYYDIPLEYPKLDDGSLVTTVYEKAAKGEFEGIVNHYNLTYNKIDCAGLDLASIINGLKK